MEDLDWIIYVTNLDFFFPSKGLFAGIHDIEQYLVDTSIILIFDLQIIPKSMKLVAIHVIWTLSVVERYNLSAK